MLPKIDTPVYTIKLLSTGESLKVKPYTVKQEKTLLVALESRDVDQIFESILTVIQDCLVDNTIDVRSLASFDVEGLFVAIRSRSVGEGVKLKIKCDQCETMNEHGFDLSEFHISSPPIYDYKVKLSSTIGFVAKYPSLTDMKGIINESKSAVDQLILVAAV